MHVVALPPPPAGQYSAAQLHHRPRVVSSASSRGPAPPRRAGVVSAGATVSAIRGRWTAGAFSSVARSLSSKQVHSLEPRYWTPLASGQDLEATVSLRDTMQWDRRCELRTNGLCHVQWRLDGLLRELVLARTRPGTSHRLARVGHRSAPRSQRANT